MLFFDGQPITFTGAGSQTFCPRWLCPDHPGLRSRRRCVEVESLWAFCRDRRPTAVALYRNYALGDILMLLPLARMMHRVLGLPQPIRVVVHGRYHVGLKRMRDDRVVLLRACGVRDYGADMHLDLNGSLETDHQGGEASEHHRMMLYARAIGIPAELMGG